MAKSDLKNPVFILSKKIDSLLDQRSKFIVKINELKKENQELRTQLEIKSQLLEKSFKDVEFLSLSHRLADSPEALIKARKEISLLIRTIDSCIRLLKED